MKRLLIRITAFLLLLTLSALMTLVWIVGSPIGSNWAINQLNEFESRLTIDYQAGSLWSGLQINSFHWDDQSNVVKLENIHSQWHLSCLLKGTLCIKNLSADSVVVHINQPKDQNKQVISLPNIVVPIAIELDELKIMHLEITSPGKQFDIDDIALQGALKGDQLVVKHLSADYQKYTAELSGSLQLSGDYPLDIQVQVVARQLLEGQDETVSLRLFNSVKNIEFEGRLSGVVALSFNGNAKPLDENLPYFSNIQWQQLSWPLIGESDFSAHQGHINIQGEKFDYKIDLNTKMTGKNIPESTIHAKLDGDFQKVEVIHLVAKTLSGAVTLDGLLSWKEQLKWKGSVQFSQINPGVYWQDYPGELNGEAQVSGLVNEGNLQMAVKDMLVYGEFRGYPLKLNADVEQTSEGHIFINEALLDMGDNKLFAKGSLTDQWDLTGHIKAPQLDIFSSDMGGQLLGSFSILGNTKKPDVQVSLKGENVRYQDNSIGDLELQAKIKSLAENESQIELVAREIKAANIAINQSHIQLKGTRSKHLLQWVVESEEHQVDATLEGAISQQQGWSGVVNSAQIKSMGERWSLVDSVALSWRTEASLFHVEPHCWQQKQAELCLLNQLTTSDDEEARVTLSGYELSELKKWLPEKLMLTGVMNAYSHTVWRDQSLTTTLYAEVNNGEIEFEDDESGEFAVFKYQKLAAKVEAKPEQFEVDFTLLSRALGDAEMNLVIDPKQQNKPVAGLVQVDGLNIEFLRGFFPKLKTLTGIVNATGKIEGTLKRPAYIGRVALESLTIDSPSLPIGVENGDINFDLSGDKGVFQGAWQTGGGPVALSGSADWSRAAFQADLTITGEQLAVQYPPVIDAKVSPDVTIQVRSQNIDIKGKIEIPQGRIKLKELPENAIALSSDVVIIDESSELEAAGSSAWRVNTNLLLTLGRDVRLSGFGLRALLAGELRIIQAKSGEPEAYGEIFVVEGTYKGYGQDLETEGGRIVFVGPLDSTALEIDAVRKTDDVTAGLQIRGTVDQPDISLFSEPQQSEEDTLAYIVLGRPTLRSEAEGSVLASAALSLGVKGGRRIATKIAKKLGIREFEIEASEQKGQSQVVFSGRLLPHLTMRYGVGVFTPESTWTLRYDLTERFYIETIQGLESSLDIFYSFDFQSARGALFK